MILSMTGYGFAQLAEDRESYALEIRTVNNRYLKLSFKLPSFLQFAETAVEKLVRGRIARGTVEYVLRVRGDHDASSCTIHAGRLQQYLRQLAEVKLPSGLQATVDLAALAALPGVCEEAEPDETEQSRRLAFLERLTGLALDALTAMRREEGAALQRELEQLCGAIRDKLREVAARAPLVVEEYHVRLRARVAALMKESGLELEAEGLMREVAIYAERCDINEELSRLGSHLDQFSELCRRDDQVGRTMDFLTQELLREANTIASKSNDALIARNIVDVKGLIDRLREQVQNVE